MAGSLSTTDSVALGCAAGFLVLAVIGFLFVSTVSGVVMLVLAVAWPLFYRSFFGGERGTRDR